MIRTPTYHVFDMYTVHHDAVKLPVYIESDDTGGMSAGTTAGTTAVSASASMDDAGRIHISMTNIDLAKEQTVQIELRGVTVSPSIQISGQIITAEKKEAHNTFEKPDSVTVKAFTGAAVSGNSVMVHLPPQSLVTVELA
jgi:alpha-N-arabinofuranosidase